jgi:hypothetical protein
MACQDPLAAERAVHGSIHAPGLAIDDYSADTPLEITVAALSGGDVLADKVEKWPPKPDVQIIDIIQSLLSKTAEWILALAPVVFLGKFPSKFNTPNC